MGKNGDGWTVIESRVAACCIRVGVPLVTLTRKDFADFATHEGLIVLHHDDA
jgi:predicted nucleic acid-binding protein